MFAYQLSDVLTTQGDIMQAMCTYNTTGVNNVTVVWYPFHTNMLHQLTIHAFREESLPMMRCVFHSLCTILE